MRTSHQWYWVRYGFLENRCWCWVDMLCCWYWCCWWYNFICLQGMSHDIRRAEYEYLTSNTKRVQQIVHRSVLYTWHLCLIWSFLQWPNTTHPTCATLQTFLPWRIEDENLILSFRLRSLWSYHPSCLVILLSLCGLNPLQSHAPTLHHNPEGINFLIIVIIIVTIMVNSHTMPMALCKSRLRDVAFKTFGRD